MKIIPVLLGTVKVLIPLAVLLNLAACDFFGEGDNSPTVFDSAQKQAARAERRAQSPATHIYGKRFDFVHAVVDGKKVTPLSSASIVLEELSTKGYDGCTAFAADGGGIFTPSGYEYTLLDSKTITTPEGVDCGPGEHRFTAVQELKGRVWSLSYKEGQLEMKDYDGAPYEFLLRLREGQQ